MTDVEQQSIYLILTEGRILLFYLKGPKAPRAPNSQIQAAFVIISNEAKSLVALTFFGGGWGECSSLLMPGLLQAFVFLQNCAELLPLLQTHGDHVSLTHVLDLLAQSVFVSLLLYFFRTLLYGQIAIMSWNYGITSGHAVSSLHCVKGERLLNNITGRGWLLLLVERISSLEEAVTV